MAVKQIKNTKRKVQEKDKLTWNQSMVQQLIREGNCRRRFRKASPIGLKAMMICRFSLQRVTKNANSASGLKSAFLSPAAAWAAGRTAYMKHRKSKSEHKQFIQSKPSIKTYSTKFTTFHTVSNNNAYNIHKQLYAIEIHLSYEKFDVRNIYEIS